MTNDSGVKWQITQKYMNDSKVEWVRKVPEATMVLFMLRLGWFLVPQQKTFTCWCQEIIISRSYIKQTNQACVLFFILNVEMKFAILKSFFIRVWVSMDHCDFVSSFISLTREWVCLYSAVMLHLFSSLDKRMDKPRATDLYASHIFTREWIQIKGGVREEY